MIEHVDIYTVVPKATGAGAGANLVVICLRRGQADRGASASMREHDVREYENGYCCRRCCCFRVYLLTKNLVCTGESRTGRPQ